MKFVCNTKILSEACLNVQRVVSTKSTILAIEGILMKAEGSTLTLTGYDLEVGMTTTLDVKVIEPGSIVLDSRIFCDILRNLPDDMVTVEVDSHGLSKITCGDIRYKLGGISASEYPELPKVYESLPVNINSSVLEDMIKKTGFAAANANSQHKNLQGIKFEITNNQIRLVALDGYRMAIRTEKINYNGEDISFVVPTKTLSEVVKLLVREETTSLNVAKRHIVFKIGDYEIISRLLDKNNLDYRAGIPNKWNIEVEVDIPEFINSVERTSLLITNDRTKIPLNCRFEDGRIKISVVNSSIGSSEDSISAKITGEGVHIGIDNRFLLDALKASVNEDVLIKLNGPFDPISIVPKTGEKFFYLILPVRLRNY